MGGKRLKGQRRKFRRLARSRSGRRRFEAISELWGPVATRLGGRDLPLVFGVGVTVLSGLILVGTGRVEAGYWLLVLVGPAALILWAWPNWRLGLTAALLYVQPLLIYWGNTSYNYTKTAFSLGAISLLLVLWAVDWILGRAPFWAQATTRNPRGKAADKGEGGEAKLQLTGLRWPVLLIVGAALVSLIHAPEFLADFQYIVLLVYFGAFGLWVANLVRTLEEVKLLVGTVLGSAMVASAYALLQYFGLLPGSPEQPNGAWAILSTFGHRNYMAGFLAYLFVPGLWLLFFGLEGSKSWAPWARTGMLVALGVIFVTLVAADSDSAWLAFLLAVGTWIGLGLWGTVGAGHRAPELWDRLRHWGGALLLLAGGLTAALELGTLRWVEGQHPKLVLPLAGLGMLSLLPSSGALMGLRAHRPDAFRRVLIGCGASCGALMLGLVLLLTFSPLQESARRIVGAHMNTLLSREINWVIGYEMLLDHPLIGTGLGDYKREYLGYRARLYAPLAAEELPSGPEEKGAAAIEAWYGLPRRGDLPADQAHNEYVQIAAEMGALGLLATGALLVGIGRLAARRFRSTSIRSVRAAIAACLAGVIAFASDSIFSFPLHLPANALVLVALLGLLSSPALGQPEGVLRLRGLGRLLLAGGTMLIALTVSVLAYRDWEADRLLDRAIETGGGLRGIETLLERSLALDPTPSAALYLLGSIKVIEGEFEEGRRLLQRSLALTKRGYSYFLLAFASFHLGDFAEAQRYLEILKTLRLPSRDLRLQVRELEANLKMAEGYWKKAIPILQWLLQQNHRPEKVHIDLGEAYLRQGNVEKAQEHLRKGLMLLSESLAGERPSDLPLSQLRALEERAKKLLQEAQGGEL